MKQMAEQTQTQTGATKPKTWAEARTSAATMPKILPQLSFFEDKELILDEAIVEFQEAEPHVVKANVLNRKTGKKEPKEWFSIDVLVVSIKPKGGVSVQKNEQMTLPVSAVSLQNGIAALQNESEDLEGVRARIFVDYYQHKEHGKTARYNVSLIETSG
jgi:hypothetical protein